MSWLEQYSLPDFITLTNDEATANKDYISEKSEAW